MSTKWTGATRRQLRDETLWAWARLYDLSEHGRHSVFSPVRKIEQFARTLDQPFGRYRANVIGQHILRLGGVARTSDRGPKGNLWVMNPPITEAQYNVWNVFRWVEHGPRSSATAGLETIFGDWAGIGDIEALQAIVDAVETDGLVTRFRDGQLVGLALLVDEAQLDQALAPQPEAPTKQEPDDEPDDAPPPRLMPVSHEDLDLALAKLVLYHQNGSLPGSSRRWILLQDGVHADLVEPIIACLEHAALKRLAPLGPDAAVGLLSFRRITAAEYAVLATQFRTAETDRQDTNTPEGGD